jgi:hypothetical protein
MANRARGWRRIGIVLSVIWFVGFGGFLWTSEVERIGDFFTSQLRTCKAILDADDEGLSLEEYLKRHDGHWKKYESCQNRASAFFGSQHRELWQSIPILFAMDAATVLIGWLVVWGIVAVVRWINRGFASV